jgi:hypothetical protein
MVKNKRIRVAIYSGGSRARHPHRDIRIAPAQRLSRARCA